MSLDRLHQFPALWVLTSVRGRYRLVETVDDAAQLLVQHWPPNEGNEYIGALAACRDALLGIVPANNAREALMRAADEAFICYICVIEGGGGFKLPLSARIARRARLKSRGWFGIGA